MPDCFAEASDGVILIANGIDPVYRWAGDTQYVEEAGVKAPTQQPFIGFIGNGLGTLSGTYACFVRFVDRYGNVSNLSPVSNQMTFTKVQAFGYIDVPISTEPSVVRRQILRNLDGEFTTFYVDVDTTDLTSTTFQSTNTDDQLGSNEQVPLLDTSGFPLANRYNPPPDTHPIIAMHISRCWYFGYQEYGEGSVKVTQFSNIVTGVGTKWPKTFAGRFLYVQGKAGLEIASINIDTQTLTLVDAYQDETDLFAQYVIQPSPGDRQLLVFSEAGLPQAVPPINALSLPEDGDRITGGTEFSSFLYIFKRRKVYRMTAQSDPSKDGFIFYAFGRGCVNNHCWVIVEQKLYMMDESGIYATAGGDEIQQLSSPIQNLFRPGDNTAINWGASRWFHASYDQSGETIRWFVATSSSYLPRTALCLHYPSGKWTTEQYPISIGSSLAARVSRSSDSWGAGPALVFLGGPAGAVYNLKGLLDGPPVDGPTTRGYATDAGVDSLTDATASFDTTNSINAPIVIVEGRGKGQIHRIVDATATVLKIDEPWAVMPDTSSRYQVGGIPIRLLTGRMRYTPSEQQTGRSVEVQYVPTEEDIKLRIGVRTDFATKNRLMGRTIGPGQSLYATTDKDDDSVTVNLQDPAGAFFQRFDGGRELSTDAPRLFAAEIEGVSGPEQIVLGEMIFNGAVR